jgi:DedD protein
MTKKVSGKDAALQYLSEKGGGPLPVQEVAKAAADRAKLKGKTPVATVAAAIYTGAAKGVGFKITGRGMVALADEQAETADPAGEPADGSEAAPPPATRQAKPDPKPERVKQDKKQQKRRTRQPAAA